MWHVPVLIVAAHLPFSGFICSSMTEKPFQNKGMPDLRVFNLRSLCFRWVIRWTCKELRPWTFRSLIIYFLDTNTAAYFQGECSFEKKFQVTVRYSLICITCFLYLNHEFPVSVKVLVMIGHWYAKLLRSVSALSTF